VLGLKRLIIDTGITQNRCLVFENGKIIDIYVDDIIQKNLSGNIYKARVENINNNLGVAFLNIGEERNAFIELKEIPNVQKGDELIIQIKRDSEGNKGPKATSKVIFPGKNLKLIVGLNEIKNDGLDKNLYESVYSLLKEIVKKDLGIIISSMPEDFNMLIEEYNDLTKKWNFIKERANYIKAPFLLLNERDFIKEVILKNINTIEEVIVTKSSVRDIVAKFIDQSKIKIDLESATLIDKYIFDVMKRKHYFYDANIVIDEVEAFTIIDVNSGDINGKNIQTFLDINKLAADKIFQLLKLRNSSGIIFIDFIDIKKNQREELLQYIKEIASKDENISKIYGWTRLGVLELSRAKKGRKLKDLIFDDYYKELLNPSYILKIIENKCLVQKERFNRKSLEAKVSCKTFELAERIKFKEKIKENMGLELNFKVNNNILNYEV